MEIATTSIGPSRLDEADGTPRDSALPCRCRVLPRRAQSSRYELCFQVLCIRVPAKPQSSPPNAVRRAGARLGRGSASRARPTQQGPCRDVASRGEEETCGDERITESFGPIFSWADGGTSSLPRRGSDARPRSPRIRLASTHHHRDCLESRLRPGRGGLGAPLRITRATLGCRP